VFNAPLNSADMRNMIAILTPRRGLREDGKSATAVTPSADTDGSRDSADTTAPAISSAVPLSGMPAVVCAPLVSCNSPGKKSSPEAMAETNTASEIGPSRHQSAQSGSAQRVGRKCWGSSPLKLTKSGTAVEPSEATRSTAESLWSKVMRTSIGACGQCGIMATIVEGDSATAGVRAERRPAENSME
jgi:hypothetical protein